MSGLPSYWTTYKTDDPEYHDPFPTNEHVQEFIKDVEKKGYHVFDKHQRTSISEWWQSLQEENDDDDKKKTEKKLAREALQKLVSVAALPEDKFPENDLLALRDLLTIQQKETDQLRE